MWFSLNRTQSYSGYRFQNCFESFSYNIACWLNGSLTSIVFYTCDIRRKTHAKCRLFSSTSFVENEINYSKTVQLNADTFQRGFRGRGGERRQRKNTELLFASSLFQSHLMKIVFLINATFLMNILGLPIGAAMKVCSLKSLKADLSLLNFISLAIIRHL